ncbi:MAG TPA: hypothetical protein VGV59_13615 [Pyrinomonadaceae bacterium]|nr:hypothetical protein [Pyrinomonadaceae bacterium]
MSDPENPFEDFAKDFTVIRIESSGQVTAHAPDPEEDFRQLLGFLPDKLNHSLDLMSAGDYQGIIHLWEPVAANQFFRADLDWSERPRLRVHILGGRCLLFIAYANSHGGDFRYHLRRAFGILQELLRCEPYVSGTGDPPLSVTETLTQNLNFLDTLNFAADWLGTYDSFLELLEDISEVEVSDAYQKVYERARQLREATGARERP